MRTKRGDKDLDLKGDGESIEDFDPDELFDPDLDSMSPD